MQLTDKQVKEFQKLYHKEYGEAIDEKEAYAKGLQVILFVRSIYKLSTRKQPNKN